MLDSTGLLVGFHVSVLDSIVCVLSHSYPCWVLLVSMLSLAGLCWGLLISVLGATGLCVESHWYLCWVLLASVGFALDITPFGIGSHCLCFGSHWSLLSFTGHV